VTIDNHLSPGSRVCGYARDSGGHEQDYSIGQQVQAISQFCKDNDLVLSRVFKDEARPGSTVAGRDEFLEMLSYLDRGAPESGVIFWSYSRFSRNYDDLIYYITGLRKLGKTIVSLTDAIPDTLDGRILESITAWKNAKYLEDLSRDIRRGMRHVISNLKTWHGGHPPKGYRLERIDAGQRRDGMPHETSHLVPDENTAGLVRRAFEMRAGGATLSEILVETNLVGSTASMGRLMKNKIYIGVREYGGFTVENYCEPLVSMQTWLAAQRVNKERFERHGYNHPRRVRSRFILTGLLRCGVCGKPMHGRMVQNKHYPQYDYYRCQSQTDFPSCGAPMIPKEEVERLVIERVRERVLEPPFLGLLYDEARRAAVEGSDEVRAELGHKRREAGDLDRAISRVVAAITEHGHSRALLDQLRELEERQAETAAEVAELEARLASKDFIQFSEFEIGELAGEIRAVIDEGDDALRRTVLRSFVREIRARRVDGVIELEVWAFFPG